MSELWALTSFRFLMAGGVFWVAGAACIITSMIGAKYGW